MRRIPSPQPVMLDTERLIRRIGNKLAHAPEGFTKRLMERIKMRESKEEQKRRKE